MTSLVVRQTNAYDPFISRHKGEIMGARLPKMLDLALSMRRGGGIGLGYRHLRSRGYRIHAFLECVERSRGFILTTINKWCNNCTGPVIL